MTSVMATVSDAALHPAHPGRGRAFLEVDEDTAPRWRRFVRAVYRREAAHRLTPWGVARVIADVQAAVMWRSPRVRANALQHMTFLLANAGDAHDFETLARTYVRTTCRTTELHWRPWRTSRRPVEGVDILRSVVARGEGAVISFMHLGNYYSVFPSLNRAGITDIDVAVAPAHFFGKHKIGPRQGRRTVEYLGAASAFNALGSFETIAQMLTDGRLVALAWDVPGATEVEFLGRRVGVASGTARLALRTGALIVPVTAQGPGVRESQPLRIEHPIDPRGFTSAQELMQAVAAAHEDAARRWPDGVVLPAERWHDRVGGMTPAQRSQPS